MKRIISLLSCLVIVAACVVVPVSAATDYEDGQLMELLDYKNAIDSVNNIITFTKSGVLNYNLPARNLVSYVDIVFEFWGSGGGPKITSAKLIRNKTEVFSSLTFAKVSTHMYRAYGAVSMKHFDTIGLQIDVDLPNEGCSFSIESFKIGLFNSTSDDLDGKLEVNANGRNTVLTHDPASHAAYSWNPGDDGNVDFGVSLYCYNNWRKYDYIDYTIGLAVRQITSITVTSNGAAVPFEVSEVYSSSDISDTMYMVTIRVDQTNVDRSAVSNYPEVAIWGNSFWDEENVVVVSSIVGHLKYTYENPIFYWFKQTYNSLTKGFDNVVKAITGNSDDMAQTGQDMQDAADDLNDEAAAFDQIETPDIDVQGLTDQFLQFSPSGLTVLATITNNSYVSLLLILVFTFALIAYVLFGKR